MKYKRLQIKVISLEFVATPHACLWCCNKLRRDNFTFAAGLYSVVKIGPPGVQTRKLSRQRLCAVLFFKKLFMS